MISGGEKSIPDHNKDGGICLELVLVGGYVEHVLANQLSATLGRQWFC